MSNLLRQQQELTLSLGWFHPPTILREPVPRALNCTVHWGLQTYKRSSGHFPQKMEKGANHDQKLLEFRVTLTPAASIPSRTLLVLIKSYWVPFPSCICSHSLRLEDLRSWKWLKQLPGNGIINGYCLFFTLEELSCC